MAKVRRGSALELGLRQAARLTEEEDRSVAWTAAVVGRRWKWYLADAHARDDYSGLGLSQYTIGNLRTVVAKLGPGGLKKLKTPRSQD
jgi:hypothetical protein